LARYCFQQNWAYLEVLRARSAYHEGETEDEATNRREKNQWINTKRRENDANQNDVEEDIEYRLKGFLQLDRFLFRETEGVNIDKSNKSAQTSTNLRCVSHASSKQAEFLVNGVNRLGEVEQGQISFAIRSKEFDQRFQFLFVKVALPSNGKESQHVKRKAKPGGDASHQSVVHQFS
jgi:hypothetical protein